MNLPRSILLFGLAILAPIAGMAAFSPDGARALYREKYSRSAPGAYEDGDIVVFVLEVRRNDGDDPDVREMARLEAKLDAIGKWISPTSAPKVASPFGPKLTAIVQGTKTLPFSIPEADACDLELTETKSGERFAVAIDAAPLRAARAKAAAGSDAAIAESPDAWAAMLKNADESLAAEEGKRTLRSLLGMPFIDAAAAPGVAADIERADMVAAARAVMECPSPKTAVEADRILSAIPTYPPALLLRAALARSGKNFAAAIVFADQASLAGDPGTLVAEIASEAAQTFETDAWLEWLRLREDFRKGDSFFSGRDKPLWKYLRICGGTIAFPGARAGGEHELEQAKELFRRGKDVPKILELLCASIEKGPGSAEKWTWLARTLQVDGKATDALLCYQEALGLGAAPEAVLPRMLALLDAGGRMKLAEGTAWWILAFGGKADAAARAVIAKTHGEFHAR